MKTDAQAREGKVSDREFETRWTGHIDELTKLGYNLPEKEDRDKLKELQEELKDLLAEASSNRGGE